MNKASYDNHFILCSDGRMFNLLDVTVYDESIDNTVKKITEEHGEILKASYSPLKIFEEINGVTKDGKFMPLGETNWKRLFEIRGQFEYYLAYIRLNSERKIVATSHDGMFWEFNIIDA